MKIHPRAKIYNQAKNELDKFVILVVEDYELTSTELVALLTERTSWWARQVMYEERKATDSNNTDNTTEHLEEVKT